MLESLFKGILNISLYATVVAFVVMLIKPICGKRLSPGFHYGIWFLFLFKLAFPFDIKSVFSVFTLFNRVVHSPITEQINTVIPPITTNAFVQSASLQYPNLTAELPVVVKGLDLWNVAAILWLIGIMIMLATLLFSYIKTNRIIKATSKEPDGRLFDIFSICKAELNIRYDVPVCTTGSFEVPFIFGFIKPMIILPVYIHNKLSDEGIKAILSHELMHIKRRDYLVNLILFLLKSVYWFNPIVWLSFAWMKNDGEWACDGAVVKGYSNERRGEYARALLDVAASVGKRTYIPAISAFTEGNFKGRVKNVLKERRYSFMAAFVAVIVIIAAGIVLLSGAQAKKEDDSGKAEVVSLVEAFGQKLQTVSLNAPKDIVAQSMQENYGSFVSPELLAQWLDNPLNAPGRVLSSPWPDHIEILSVEKLSESKYEVKGEIIEMTSVEMVEGGAAAKRPITLLVEKIEDGWFITDSTLDPYRVMYMDRQYGFSFSLPESWQGYSVVTDQWQGYAIGGPEDAEPAESGPMISLRHPQWTSQNPRQDIPIMVFTIAQWNLLQQEKLRIGAAPMGPSELGRNTGYVFALPARYNYAFPTGYEEVEAILRNNPLQVNDNYSDLFVSYD